MNYGSSECADCGTEYRYESGKAIPLDEIEPESSPELAVSPTGFHPPRGARPHAQPSNVRPKRGLALATVLSLVATQVFDLVEAGLGWLLVFLVQRGVIDHGSSFEVYLWRLFAASTAIRLCAGVLFMLWMRDCNHVVRAHGVAGLRCTRASYVYGWLIPIVNLLLPYRAMVELWKASDPESGPDDWQRSRVSPALPWWWAAWLTAGITGVVLSATLFAHHVPYVGWIVSTLVELVACALAVWIVWALYQRLEKKADPGR